MTELYDRLISKCTGFSFSKDHSSKLLSLADQINAFDHQAIEMTFVLIRIHSLRSGNSKGFFQLPYDGKSEAPTGDTSIVNVIFNLEHFPEDLLCLLDQFAKTVEGSRGETTKMKPLRSPRSPRGSSSPKHSSQSFMKANRQKPIPEIVLHEIDCAGLDKTYSMDEILKYGEKSFFTELSNDLSTSTDDIGLVEDTRHQRRLILEREDSFTRDPFELAELDDRISVYDNKKGESCCFYCTLSIPDEWKPVQAYDGVFCSFHCARSYSIETRSPYSVLSNLYRKLKRQEAPLITRSPDRLLLQKFGGSLSEEEYRRMFNSPYPVHTISQSMADPICTSGDDGNDGYSAYSRTSKMSGSYAIHYKAAATCSINEPEKCVRVYKAN